MARLVLLGALLALLPAPAAAADLEGRARLSLGAGVDSNARRDYVPAGPVPDGMVSAHGSVEGRATFERSQLLGSYDGGVRKFLLYPSEDVLMQGATAEGSLALGRFAGTGVMLRGRDRRGGERDYTDLLGRAFVDYVPDAALDLRVWAGGHRFLYWPVFTYSFAATELGAAARYRFDRRHSVNVFGEVGFRRYNDRARRFPDAAADLPPTPPREDSALVAGAGYAYRGPLALSATYAYSDQTSNSFGETVRRHRLTFNGATRLPLKLYATGQLAVQLSSYPDGVGLSEELFLEEEAENLSSFSLKLARPLSSHFDLELRYAVYYGRLPRPEDPGAASGAGHEELRYFRQVGWLGVTLRY